MEIEFKGGNAVIITTKKASIITDPVIEAQDNRVISNKHTIQLATQQKFVSNSSISEALIIDGPGEYEIANISIKGVAANSHIDSESKKNSATMYSLDIEDIKIAVLGHVAPSLSDEQLELLGVIDVLIIPVGGYGYTLEPHEAVSLVRRIGPKIVIPTHFMHDSQDYSITQGGLEDFTKELGAPVEKTTKLKMKSAAALPEVLTVVEVI